MSQKQNRLIGEGMTWIEGQDNRENNLEVVLGSSQPLSTIRTSSVWRVMEKDQHFRVQTQSQV